jgi:hypothetical protein
MQASAPPVVWNWEGRIWIDAWNDVKWINLRATPHAAGDGGGAVGRHHDQHHRQQARAAERGARARAWPS